MKDVLLCGGGVFELAADTSSRELQDVSRAMSSGRLWAIHSSMSND
jgi:hypothetical protein